MDETPLTNVTGGILSLFSKNLSFSIKSVLYHIHKSKIKNCSWDIFYETIQY